MTATRKQQLLFSLATLSLLVLVTAESPCDTAFQFIEEFSQCLYTNSSIFMSSIYLNSIYNSVTDDTKNEFLQESPLDDLDKDGKQACGAGIEEIRQCVEPRFQSCSELESAVDQEVDAFRGRFCEQSGETWQYSSLALRYFVDISQAFLQLSSDSGSGDTQTEVPCLYALFESGILESNGTCFAETFSTDIEAFINETSYITAKDSLSRIFGTQIKCLFQEIKNVGCNDDVSSGFLAYLVLFTTPPGIDYGFENLDVLLNTAEKPTESERMSSVVFGDPHMISYDGESFLFSTCAGEGESHYLQNNYVTIIGYNTAVMGSEGFTPPTYMTQVNITFKDIHGDTVGTYSFTGGDSLPSTFDNGDTDINGGTDSSDDNGANVGEASNSVKRIFYKRGGIVIGLKKIGNTLAMNVRMAKSLYVSSNGYMVVGCPGQELDIQGNRRKRGAGSEVCGNLGLTDDYVAACEYDVDITEDTDTVTGQYESIQEMEEAAEELDDFIIVDEITTQASASGLRGHVTTIAAILFGYVYFL